MFDRVEGSASPPHRGPSLGTRAGWRPGQSSGAPGRWLSRGESAVGQERYTPAGWPDAVLPPSEPDWENSATNFLFDCCPADFRGYGVLRRHPVVLARFAAAFVESQLRVCSEGVGATRAALADVVNHEVVEESMQAWMEQQAILRRRRREIALIEETLRGKVFVRKL